MLENNLPLVIPNITNDFEYWSFSRVDSYRWCPRKFKYRYIDGLKAEPSYQANHPLTIGTCLHMGNELGIEAAESWYYDQFPVCNNKQVEEIIKIKWLVKHIRPIIDELSIVGQEVEIRVDGFRGYIDLVTKNPDGTVDLWDYKYSNNIDDFMKKEQLIVYKHTYERMTGQRVRKMWYLFAPKLFIRQRKDEQNYEFRIRLRNQLESATIKIVEVVDDLSRFKKFGQWIHVIEQDEQFAPTTDEKKCDWCEYQKFCKEGNDIDMLPKNERRVVGVNNSVKAWIQGGPFVGKTYFLNEAPNVIMLNTDGNIEEIDAPYIAIRDQIVKNERGTGKKMKAWEIFEDSVDDLLKGKHDFENIVVDLVEDIHEFSRLMVYSELGIKHESDAKWGKGSDMVKMKFMPTMKRLLSSDYNVWIVSHTNYGNYTDDAGLDHKTTIPTMSIKNANKLAGMVKVVLLFKNNNGKRTIEIKQDKAVFGGTRLPFEKSTYPMDFETFMAAYHKAVKKQAVIMAKKHAKPVTAPVTAPVAKPTRTATRKPVEQTPATTTTTPDPEHVVVGIEPAPITDTPEPTEPITAPVTKTRRRRVVKKGEQ